MEDEEGAERKVAELTAAVERFLRVYAWAASTACSRKTTWRGPRPMATMK
jgi:hypothetical protein